MNIIVKLNNKLLLVFILLLYICLSLLIYDFVDEDAYIYFRCADNIAHGYGYVFNRGAEHVEACSSTIWIFLLVASIKLGFDVITSAKMLGIFFGVLTLFMVFNVTKKLNNKLPWVILPSFLTAINIPFLCWNLSGLETSVYTFLIMCLIYVCLSETLFNLLPIVTLLMLLARPEGFFILIALFPVFYLNKEKKGGISLSIIALIVLIIITIAMRFIYFNDFLPNPFYTKIQRRTSLPFWGVHDYFNISYLYFFLIPLLCVFWKKRNFVKNRAIILGFIIILLTWYAFAGNEPKPYFRQLVPLTPLFLIYVITALGENINLSRLRPKVIAVCYFCVFILASLVFYSHDAAEDPNPVFHGARNFIRNPVYYSKALYSQIAGPFQSRTSFELIAKFIKQNYFGNSIIIYDQMGQVPFLAGTEYSFIDSWGLTDKTIGHYYFYLKNSDKRRVIFRLYERILKYISKMYFPDSQFVTSQKGLLDYIFRETPDVIILTKLCMLNGSKLPYLICMDQRLKANYSLKYLFFKHTLVFEKKGLKTKSLTIPDGFDLLIDKAIIEALNQDAKTMEMLNGQSM